MMDIIKSTVKELFVLSHSVSFIEMSAVKPKEYTLPFL